MKRLYLVTGAAGHLGGTVIRHLQARGQDVRGLLLPAENPVVEGPEYVRGDVRRPESLLPLFQCAAGQSLCVIHTAGLVDISGEMTPMLREVNVDGVKNMLAVSQQYSVDRFVHVSSVHAIPEKPGIQTEIDHFSPDEVVGGYAKTKAEATQAVLDAARAGFPAVVVHPSGILGPYDMGRNHLVQMLKDFMEGRLPACVQGGYDVVDVRDVADGCILASERGRPGQCYILSGGYAEIRELLGTAAILCGKRCPPTLPVSLARAVEPFLQYWAKCRNQRPLYTRYSLDTISSQTRFSSQKARTELGFCTRSMQATVRDTVSWLWEHGSP